MNLHLFQRSGWMSIETKMPDGTGMSLIANAPSLFFGAFVGAFLGAFIGAFARTPLREGLCSLKIELSMQARSRRAWKAIFGRSRFPESPL
jgi:hypothetical protein